MSVTLRILLVAVSFLTFVYMIRKIGKSQMQIRNSVPIILFSLVLVIISIFPGIVTWLAKLIGVESPANLVFLGIIFGLLMMVFAQSVKLSLLENKLTKLAQRYAIDRAEDIAAERKEQSAEL